MHCVLRCLLPRSAMEVMQMRIHDAFHALSEPVWAGETQSPVQPQQCRLYTMARGMSMVSGRQSDTACFK